MFSSMKQVIKKYPTWFSQESMDFFGTTIETDLIDGQYFITSEVGFAARRFGDGKFYHIRKADESGISLIGDSLTYETLYHAMAVLSEHLAEDDDV